MADFLAFQLIKVTCNDKRTPWGISVATYVMIKINSLSPALTTNDDLRKTGIVTGDDFDEEIALDEDQIFV